MQHACVLRLLASCAAAGGDRHHLAIGVGRRERRGDHVLGAVLGPIRHRRARLVVVASRERCRRLRLDALASSSPATAAIDGDLRHFALERLVLLQPTPSQLERRLPRAARLVRPRAGAEPGRLRLVLEVHDLEVAQPVDVRLVAREKRVELAQPRARALRQLARQRDRLRRVALVQVVQQPRQQRHQLLGTATLRRWDGVARRVDDLPQQHRRRRRAARTESVQHHPARQRTSVRARPARAEPVLGVRCGVWGGADDWRRGLVRVRLRVS